jgi:hypothetical protein
LDVLYRGLGISKLEFFIKKILKRNFALFLSSLLVFLSSKTCSGLDLDLDSLEMLHPDPYPDPNSINREKSEES